MGATTVKFEFNVARHEDLYGFTLRVRDHEEGQEEQDDEECTSYHLVFKGPKEGDLSDVCDKFMACHKEARDSIGLVDKVSHDEFEEKMDTSIELAGDLMSRHGFKVEETENVDEDVLDALFSDDGDDCPDMDEPVVLFRVNNYEFNKPDPRWRLNLGAQNTLYEIRSAIALVKRFVLIKNVVSQTHLESANAAFKLTPSVVFCWRWCGLPLVGNDHLD